MSKIEPGQIWTPEKAKRRIVLAVRVEDRPNAGPQPRVYWTTSERVATEWANAGQVVKPPRITPPGTQVWEEGFLEWITASGAEQTSWFGPLVQVEAPDVAAMAKFLPGVFNPRELARLRYALGQLQRQELNRGGGRDFEQEEADADLVAKLENLSARPGPSGGTFTLTTPDGDETRPLPHNATPEEIQEALDAARWPGGDADALASCCENCGAPASVYDPEGVPLCSGCALNLQNSKTEGNPKP